MDNIDIQLPFNAIATHPTGSAYTVYPPVTTTDEDFLVLVKDFAYARRKLQAHNWYECIVDDNGQPIYQTDEEYGSTWLALRKGKLNIMLTADASWYLRAVGATLVCKELNLKDKSDRCHAFRIIRDGAAYDGDFL